MSHSIYRRPMLACLAWLIVLFVGSLAEVSAQTVARCGKGWLELVDGYPVLHLKGTPYEMGYQQGALLKDRVRSNMHNLLEVKGSQKLKLGLVSVKPRAVIEAITTIQKPFVPAKYYEEMEGLAAGSGLKP
ncbi:MAG: peptidase C45, partial [Planctomycetaceae bacterium]